MRRGYLSPGAALDERRDVADMTDAFWATLYRAGRKPAERVLFCEEGHPLHPVTRRLPHNELEGEPGPDDDRDRQVRYLAHHAGAGEKCAQAKREAEESALHLGMKATVQAICDNLGHDVELEHRHPDGTRSDLYLPGPQIGFEMQNYAMTQAEVRDRHNGYLTHCHGGVIWIYTGTAKPWTAEVPSLRVNAEKDLVLAGVAQMPDTDSPVQASVPLNDVITAILAGRLRWTFAGGIGEFWPIGSAAKPRKPAAARPPRTLDQQRQARAQAAGVLHCTRPALNDARMEPRGSTPALSPPQPKPSPLWPWTPRTTGPATLPPPPPRPPLEAALRDNGFASGAEFRRTLRNARTWQARDGIGVLSEQQRRAITLADQYPALNDIPASRKRRPR